MVALGEFTFSVISNLLSNVISERINYTALPFFQRRKIERRIEDATAEVIEALLPFLTQEGISEDKQRRLIETCIQELQPLIEQTEILFQGSLNGQKIFESIYVNRDLPQVVIEDGLKDVYALLYPRIATLLCKIPSAVKDWESEAWSENFHRFDEITTELRTLFSRVDELAALPLRKADTTLTMLRRMLAQRIRFELDFTGLRADRPLLGKFDDFFVHPEIKEEVKKDSNKKQAIIAGEPDKSFNLFTLKNRRAIIIGQPGAGKSIWTKWLQREALSTRWTGICIRVELRRFSNEPLLSLHQLIKEAGGQHLAEELTPDHISEWLKTEQVVFILDGFDEIHPNERDNVYNWIVELSTAVHRCPFIITSRPLTTDHLERLSTSWQFWNVEAFDTERIIDYIQRWYTHTKTLLESNHKVDATSLAESWRRDPTIEPLTGNPLLLSTLLMVHHLDGSLPTGRSQLYRRYIEGMLGLWDERRKVAATVIQLSLPEKRQIMRGFALQMFLQGKDQLDEPAALKLVQNLLQRINISISEKDVLAGLRERTGLIIGPGIYSFVHKSVMEYLVAESVLEGDQRDESGRRIDRFCLFENREDDRWNTVTFLWSGIAPISDVETLVDECIKTKTWDLAYGIVNDQYERFLLEIRRKFLLKIINYKQNSSKIFQGDVYCAYSHPYRIENPLELPTFDLRSISSYEKFHSLIMRAVEDKTLRWSDSANASLEGRNLLWLSCVITPESMDEWKTSLMAPCPNKSLLLNWQFLIAEWVFYKTLINKDLPELRLVIKTYNDACPYARGLVPIALISAGLSIILNISRNKNYNYEILEKILNILPNSNNGEIIQDWLDGTSTWEIFSRDEPTDLLKTFTIKVKELVNKGVLKEDTVYENAIEFIEKLKQSRRN
ncbi:NACHT domain-containing protein [Nostoc sp. FACHB-87]|uniref:NACHT domain-containing protein n=1 Tax=Nostocaceae TaxID=1162 RepID=UPI001688DA36|nr:MULTISPECIES: NACHT domain-containing protein [Nostocaceae]MBD2458267.1 NACHT domain-containing protein [Nostoc sp. FACHB-87]MBD2480093.1 NACHT domain-containing protein [Anabaena sp. FACHB-83]